MENLNMLLLYALNSMHSTVITDEKGLILFLSKDYQEMLNVKTNDYVGKPVTEIIENTQIPRVIKTKKEEIGHIFKLKNGTKKVCNRIPIMDNGKLIGVISTATFYDLNEVSILTQQIKELQNENFEYKKKISELASTYNQHYSINSIIGNSKPITLIKETIQRFAKSDLTFLITGETGTGKEVFANAVHELSNRKSKNFIKINCAAIPKDLLESELFGYEAGAFSGASKEGKMGKFELANHGTLLLDEIGEMPMELQSKLLRVLQENEFERVGGLKSIKLDVRIICSTNQNIEELVESGQFRRDLFYRINVIEIHIPPLKERLDDIPLLCNYFINTINNSYGLGVTYVSDNVYSLFEEYEWIGNVRELKHILERACITAGSGPLKLEHFDFFVSRMYKNSNTNVSDKLSSNEVSLQDITADIEKEKIIKTLMEAKGNKSSAARLLNIDRSSLYNKIKKYNIDV